jgi:hypothetical protein
MSNLNYSIAGLRDLLEHATNLSTFLVSDVSKCDSKAISQLRLDLHNLLEETSSYALMLRSMGVDTCCDSPNEERAPTGAQ